MKKRVPKKLAYWERETALERDAVRKKLIQEVDDGTVYLPMAYVPNGDYAVIKEWVPREYEKYHLVIHNKGALKLSADEDITRYMGKGDIFPMQKLDMELPIDECIQGVVALSEDKPAFANAIDWGPCIVYENRPSRKVVRFMGAKMKDVVQFELNDGKSWVMNVVEVHRTSGQDLTNKQVDRIIELSKAKKERREIAEDVECAEKTVYLYQKTLGYV
jgi:hypothetical protein